MIPRARGAHRAALPLVLVLAAALGALAGCGGSADALAPPAPPAPQWSSLPATPPAAFAIGDPTRLRETRGATTWAPVRRAATARARPDEAAVPVGHLPLLTPEGTENLTVVVARALDGRGGAWVRVRLTALPNGTLGWVPRRALGGYRTTTMRLVVRRGALIATLERDGRVLFTAPIGVGRPEWPTPAGEFYVRNRLTRFASAFYGPLAFGTSARSETLTDWPAGGFVGIHGTSRPDLLPGRVSHGCVRMRNEDILRLDRLMGVGTPVVII